MTTRSAFLTGAAIDLVVLTEADAVLTHHWFNDQETARYLGRYGRPMIESDAASYYKAAATDTSRIVLGIFHKEQQVLIGTIGLHDIDHLNQTAELGIVVGVHEERGKGVGTEAITLLAQHAFQRLNLRNLTLRVLGGNTRAYRCYQRLGFVETGRLTEHLFRESTWVDEILMRLHREDLSLTEAGATERRIAHLVEKSQD